MARLFLDEVAEFTNSHEFAIVSLANEQKTRMVTIVCLTEVANAIKMRMQQYKINEILLPEATAQLMQLNGLDHYELLIDNLIEGQYMAYLHDTVSEKNVRIRITDGILLAQAAKMPICIDEELLSKQSVRYRSLKNGVSIPVNTITIDMLKESLQKAIDEEDYEMAAKLHEELKNRKNDKNGNIL